MEFDEQPTKTDFCEYLQREILKHRRFGRSIDASQHIALGLTIGTEPI